MRGGVKAEEAKAGKGKAPGREKPRRAGRPRDRGDTEADFQPAGGDNPCSEAVPDPKSGTGASADGEPTIRSPCHAPKPRGDGARTWRRGGEPPVGIADRVRNAIANRRKGSCVERRVQSLSGQALKGKPRGRARLKHAGEIATGARRRGRQERRGRNLTRRRQLREWWLVARRLRRGGRNLERADDAGGRRHGHPGKTPKRGERPRKVRGLVTQVRARRAKTTRWTNHEVGTPNP
jgi:hypothetical protein